MLVKNLRDESIWCSVACVEASREAIAARYSAAVRNRSGVSLLTFMLL